MQINTISSKNISFVAFINIIMEQPNAVLEQAKQIVVRNPELLFGSEVILRTNSDERSVELKDTDVVFDKIVLAKTETGISVGLQRKQGQFALALFQAIATAFQTARDTIQWGQYNHAKGEYTGNQTDNVKDYDFYYDGNVVFQLQGNMPTEPNSKKRTPLNATNWELVSTPNGQIFLQALGQNRQIFQTMLKITSLLGKTPEQMVQTISFDQVQLPKTDKVTSFVSIPNGNKQPMLLVAGQKGVYWNDVIVTDQNAILAVDARTGLVGIVTDNRYYTAEIQGDKITPLQMQSDQLGDDYKPLFGSSPRLLLNSEIALLTSVVKEGDHHVSFGRVLPQQPARA